ncbi:hypothetical protein [Pseudomonas sp. RT6P73]
MRTPRKPTIYSNKLTAQQNAVLAKFETLTGQWPIALEAFEAGELTAAELWRKQVAWVIGVCADVVNMPF